MIKQMKQLEELGQLEKDLKKLKKEQKESKGQINKLKRLKVQKLKQVRQDIDKHHLEERLKTAKQPKERMMLMLQNRDLGSDSSDLAVNLNVDLRGHLDESRSYSDGDDLMEEQRPLNNHKSANHLHAVKQGLKACKD